MAMTIFPQGAIFKGVRRVMADAIYPEGKNQRDHLTRQANHDSLTGLANRHAFELAKPTAEADCHTAFIVFDLNNFKAVNDSLGHSIGDDILKNAARVLSLQATRYGLATRCFRIGGDEFVILTPVDVAAALRSEVEKQYRPYQLKNGVTVSISGGIGHTFDEADHALYNRKDRQKAAYATN